MPAKRKKTSAKKFKDTSASKEMKENIHRAAEAIPSLIAEHLQVLEAPTAEMAQGYREKLHADYAAMARKRNVLWVCVSVVACVVIGMWYWNTQAVLANLRGEEESQEGIILQNATDNVEQAFSQVALQDRVRRGVQEVIAEENTQAGADVEEALRTALLPLAAQIPTTTSSTEPL